MSWSLKFSLFVAVLAEIYRVWRESRAEAVPDEAPGRGPRLSHPSNATYNSRSMT